MSSKLVLDSNVIAYLVLGTKEPYKTDPRNNENILCTLRRCYLLYSDILIADVTLEELNRFAKHRDVEVEVNDLIDSLCLTKVNVSRGQCGDMQTVKLIKPRKGLPLVGVVKHDAALVEYATKNDADIFTFDLDLLQYINQNKLASRGTFKLRFPVDDEKLKQLPFKEIRTHAEIFRSNYVSLFNEIKRLDSQIIAQNTGVGDLVEEKRRLVKQAQLLIVEKDSFIQELKDAAKPDIGFTIAFSAIELALGFLPIPIPTSPLSHVIQETKYRKVIQKHEK